MEVRVQRNYIVLSGNTVIQRLFTIHYIYFFFLSLYSAALSFAYLTEKSTAYTYTVTNNFLICKNEMILLLRQKSDL